MTNTAPPEHDDFDGIDVLDGPIPSAWKWVFIATIAFAPLYLAYYHGTATGRSAEEQYADAMAETSRLLFAEIGNLQPDEPTVLRYMQKDNWVSFGRSLFKTHCVSCHGPSGEGKVGPNLTDEHFKNINRITDIPKIINEGAGNGAMPAWSGKLLPNEIVMLSAYVATLRGTDVAGGRVAEGKEIAPWPDPPEEPAATP